MKSDIYMIAILSVILINVILIVVNFIKMKYYQVKLFHYVEKVHKEFYESRFKDNFLMEIFQFKKVKFLFNRDLIDDDMEIKDLKLKLNLHFKGILVAISAILITFVIAIIIAITL